MNMGLSVTGLEALTRRFQQMPAKVQQQATEAVNSTLQTVFEESQQQVPVASQDDREPPGTLKASGHITPAEVSGDAVTGSIAYDAEYALIVHENLEAVHAVGKAKYLEDPANQAAPGFVEKLRSLDL